MKKKINLIALVLVLVNTGFAQPLIIQKYSDVSIGGNNAWNLEQRYDFTYNEDNHIVSENLLYYSANQWQIGNATLNYYDGIYLTRSVTNTDVDGYAFKTEYEYTSDGKTSNEFFYTKDMLDETWTKKTLTHYSYVNEKLDESLVKNWNDQSQTYKDTYKTIYFYPNDNEVIATSYLKTAQPAPNDWVFDKQKITTTQNGLCYHEQYFNYDQDSLTFLPQSEVYYDYSSTGVLDSVEYSEVGINGMEKIRVENYFYNTNSSKDYIVIHKKVNGNWRYDHRLRFVYPELGLNDEKESQFIVYPNPALEMLSIGYTDAGVMTAEIFDSNGSLLVHQENIDPGQPIFITQLASGVYSICLHTASGVYNRTFVKQ